MTSKSAAFSSLDSSVLFWAWTHFALRDKNHKRFVMPIEMGWTFGIYVEEKKIGLWQRNLRKKDN